MGVIDIKKIMIAIFLNGVENKDKKKPNEIIKDLIQQIIGGLKANSIEHMGLIEWMDSLDIIFGIHVMIICPMIIWTIGRNGQKRLIRKHLEILTEKIAKTKRQKIKNLNKRKIKDPSFMLNYANMEVQSLRSMAINLKFN